VFAVTSRPVSFGALLDKSGEVCREAGGGRSIESCDVVSTAGDIGTQVIGEVIDLVHHAAEGAEVVEAVEVVPAPCLRDVAEPPLGDLAEVGDAGFAEDDTGPDVRVV